MTSRVFVTNFNRNFTGVSATAANVVRTQVGRYDLSLVGHPLPGCPDPITLKQARTASREPCIWHVRRNTEMRAAIWARDVLRLPIKIVFTSAAIRRHSAYPRWLISRMDAVVATTEKAASFVPNVRGVVPHGVDTERFTYAGDRNDRAAAWLALGYGGTRGIATIGRIRPEKGTDQFVQAVLPLLADHPDTVALIIGKATREHQGFLDGLKSQIADANLTDRVLFLGEIPAQDLPKLMKGLSLIVQLPHYEGYGMVPLEGMSCAVPFVATDTGYYRSFSAKESTGFIVDTPDAAQKAARRILKNQVEIMGSLARHTARRHFNITSEADGIDAVYQELIAKF